ncbi:hypothetical protein AAFN85_13555 [Mucilaginibacter sp. CAU 1740]|uniref:hypothetical protein n=1 Tax=Mucilaginibacter sp. CAU 1740 TaxID=3140365 RepID=UPI00325AE550
MNRIHYSLLLCLLLSIFASCNKGNDSIDPKNSQSTDLDLNASFQARLASIDTAYHPRQVVTIAGHNGERGYMDGKGPEALFDSPWGIELAQDGSLLVADPGNNKIRKVTTDGVVTTLDISTATDGSDFTRPYFIKQGKDGTLAIKTVDIESRFWIVKPAGKTTVTTGPRNGFYGSIAKDPFNDIYWTCGINIGKNNVFTGFVEKFLPSGAVGVNAQSFPPSAFTGDMNSGTPIISTIFVGYDNIKYLVVNDNQIYKLTPSGLLKQLFTNFYFDSPITDIITNKDSHTMYVSSGGNIFGISENKLYRLVGTANGDGHDGIGSGASVLAFNLALSKDESTLYFTDSRNTIRKLILK